MAEFLAFLPTLIVVALIAVAVFFSVRLICKNKGGCGGSCGSCASFGSCSPCKARECRKERKKK